MKGDKMAKVKTITITKEYGERLKAKDAKMTPAQRRAVSRGLVMSNSAANNIGLSAAAVKNSNKKKKA